MIPTGVLRQMFDYNYWAGDKQLEACAALTREQFLKPLGSSFSSVRDTLAHLVAVEWLWLERFRGRSPGGQEAAGYAPATFPDIPAIRQRWADAERNMREYLAGLTDDRLLQTISYLNLKGERSSYPLWQTIWHLINHQTYHRGQITTMLRQLGAQPPHVDFLVAVDERFRH